jgi:hypothetical protein
MKALNYNSPGPLNNKLSATAYNSVKAAYGCKLLNTNYIGPIITLRYSADVNGNSTKDFYSDTNGNLYTGPNSTGSTVISWLQSSGSNTTYAYVTKWYDQGNNTSNHSIQTSNSEQPIYDVVNKLINFGYTGTNGGVSALQKGYLYIPNNTFPANDSSFTIVTKIFNIGPNTTAQQLLLSVGNSGGNSMILNLNPSSMQINMNYISGAGAQLNTTIFPVSGVFTIKYTSVTSIGSVSNNTIIYINGTQNVNGSVASTTNFNTAPISIGNNPSSFGAYPGTTLNTQVYYLYIFSTSLSDSDRFIIEST